MIKSKTQSLKALRIEVAVNLCTQFPALYRKVSSKTPTWISDKEKVAAGVLESLLNLEPSVGHILHYYYSRMEK